MKSFSAPRDKGAPRLGELFLGMQATSAAMKVVVVTLAAFFVIPSRAEGSTRSDLPER